MAHDISQKLLKETVEKVKSSELALVHFQREYVWDADRVKKLLHSICMAYPIGTLLFLKQGSAGLAKRGFEGQEYVEKDVQFLVLDGQQRLTSLFHSLISPQGQLYFFDLSKVTEVKDPNELYRMLESAIVHFDVPRLRKGKGAKEKLEEELSAFNSTYRSNKWLVANLYFPMTGLLDAYRVRDAMKESAALGSDNDMPISAEKIGEFDARWKLLYSAIDTNVNSYHVPRVILDDGTSSNAIARIFETINNTGVKLSTFDLLVARHFGPVCDLRSKWIEMTEENSDFELFGVDELEFVEAIYLLKTTREGQDGFSANEILSTEASHYVEKWEIMRDGYVKAFAFLRSAGMYSKRDIPYGPMLMPLACLNAISANMRSLDQNKFLEGIRWWFWNCIFRQVYRDGASRRRFTHFHGLKELCLDKKDFGSIPVFKSDLDPVAQELPGAEQLLRVLPGSAVYKGVMALLLSGKYREGGPVTPKDLHSRRELAGISLDDHHIFPKQHLDDIIPNTDGKSERKDNADKWASIDNICNRTKIEQTSNRAIGKKDPRLYVNELVSEAAMEVKDAKDVLNSHMINPELPVFRFSFTKDRVKDLPMFSEKEFRDFLTDRSLRLSSLIVTACR